MEIQKGGYEAQKDAVRRVCEVRNIADVVALKPVMAREGLSFTSYRNNREAIATKPDKKYNPATDGNFFDYHCALMEQRGMVLVYK